VPPRVPDDIRSMIVAEVSKRLNPIEQTVNRLDRTLRSLYSNGSGGPPGFLETARAEDNRRFEELFRIKREEINAIKPLQTYVIEQKEKDRLIAEQLTSADKRINLKIAVLTLLIGAMMLGLAWLTYRDSQRKAELNPQVNHSAVQLPQDSTVEPH
jgi:hypothetical protein